MATCFRCGVFIAPPGPFLRRRVKTGDWIRRRYPKVKPDATSQRFGMRIVCPSCARKIDHELSRPELIQMVELGFAIAILLVLLFMKIFG